MLRPAWLILGLSLPLLADTNVQDIPPACRLHTVRVDPAGGSVEPLAAERVDGRWTTRAYELSPDGRSLAIQRANGVLVLTGTELHAFDLGLAGTTWRALRWHPDSRRLLVGASGRIVVVDTAERTHAVLHALPAGSEPLELHCAPSGEAALLLERATDSGESVLRRIELASGASCELLRREGAIDFFTVSPRGRLVFGTRGGLSSMAIDPGSAPAPLAELRADRLLAQAWNPASHEQLLLSFRRRGREEEDGGKALGGVVRVWLDRSEREQLYAAMDAHTVWFSPGGAWATWAGKRFVAYRRPDAPADQLVEVICETRRGELLEVRGCAWHPDERRLAIAAGRSLFIHDAGTGATSEVADLEGGARDVVTDPRWMGERVVLTRVEPLEAGAPERPPVTTTTPAGERPTLETLLARFKAMQGLSARFREERRLALLEAPLVDEGTLHWSRGVLARHVTSPARASMVIDRERLRMWDGKARSEVPLEKSPVARELVAGFLHILAGDGEALARLYQVELSATDDPARWRLVLRPRGKPLADTIARLEFVGKELVVERLLLVETGGDETETTFSEVDPHHAYSPEEAARVFALPGEK